MTKIVSSLSSNPHWYVPSGNFNILILSTNILRCALASRFGSRGSRLSCISSNGQQWHICRDQSQHKYLCSSFKHVFKYEAMQGNRIKEEGNKSLWKMPFADESFNGLLPFLLVPIFIRSSYKRTWRFCPDCYSRCIQFELACSIEDLLKNHQSLKSLLYFLLTCSNNTILFTFLFVSIISWTAAIRVVEDESTRAPVLQITHAGALIPQKEQLAW